MKKNVIGMFCVLIGMISGATPASAIIATFQQGTNGYSGASDTYTEYAPEIAQPYNYGGRDLMLVYSSPDTAIAKKLGFMRFDVSSLDSSETITLASLSLYIEGNPARSTGFDVTYTLYAITRTGLSFGTADGAVQDGTLSFNYSSYDTTSPVGWGTSNNVTWGPQAGQDYSTTPMGSFDLTAANADSGFVTLNLNSTVLQSWVNDPTSNLGFVIVQDMVAGPQAQAVILSADYGLVSLRPLLEVTTVPEPSVLALMCFGGAVCLMLKRKIQKRDSSKVA